MNEQSSLHAHDCFPGDMIQAQGSWLGMKNQSDILLAPEVGQTEGDTHTYTPPPLSPHYMLQLWKRGQSHSSHSRAEIEIGTPLSVHLYLCSFFYHNETYTLTHTHISDCHQV